MGHSLGGAIADIAAAEVRNAGTVCDLYTYGAPRIADKNLSGYITTQGKGGNFRVTHFDDPVPRLPPLLLGYVHISPEYYIATGNEITVTAGDVMLFAGDASMMGNGNLWNSDDLSDVAAHLW